jgi:hypothetical protein
MTESTIFEAGVHLAGRYELLQALPTPSAEAALWARDYSARDSVDLRGRIVTQLTLPEEGPARKAFLDVFYREAEKVAGFVDARLPAYSEGFVEKGSAWLVRMHAEGEPLAEQVRALQSQMPAAQARYRFKAVAELLHQLHDSPVPVYLDGFGLDQIWLKPADIVALERFDLRRFFAPDQHEALVAAMPSVDPIPGEVRAQLAARSGEDDVRVCADLWSLGALGCWLLTGSWAGASPCDLGVGRDDLDAELRSILERCLGWGSAPAFASLEELVRWLSGDAQYEIVLPAEASIRPESFAFENVGREGVAAAMFSIVNLGGGTLQGVLTTSEPWLRVSPSTFEDNDLTAQVWFDADKLGEVKRAKADVVLESNGGNLTMPVELTFAEARLKGAPVLLLSLGLLLVAALPEALLVFLRRQMYATLAKAEATNLLLTTQGSKIYDYAHQLQHYIQADFALIALVPLVCWWSIRGLSYHDRKPLLPAIGVALLLPAVVTPLLFVLQPVHLPLPTQTSALKFLDPFYASVPRAIFAVLSLLGVVLEPRHYPERWAESVELRYATWILVGLAFVEAVRTYAW